MPEHCAAMPGHELCMASPKSLLEPAFSISSSSTDVPNRLNSARSTSTSMASASSLAVQYLAMNQRNGKLKSYPAQHGCDAVPKISPHLQIYPGVGGTAATSPAESLDSGLIPEILAERAKMLFQDNFSIECRPKPWVSGTQAGMSWHHAANTI